MWRVIPHRHDAITLNQPSDPIVGPDDDWQRLGASQLKFPPVVLTMQ
ncbi:MAG: hypothetical protein KAS72_14320 [Phycisphaerales bacterium]|nr:hypothetical protein [Phycisphaerales bacterium]